MSIVDRKPSLSVVVLMMIVLTTGHPLSAAPTNPRIAAEQLALADRLMVAMEVLKVQTAIVPQVVDLILPLIVRGNEQRRGEVETILREELKLSFASRGEELVGATRDAYARNLSESELRDMIAFYETPSGKSLSRLQPTINSEAMRDGQAVGQAAARAAMPKILERLRKAKLKVPDRT